MTGMKQMIMATSAAHIAISFMLRSQKRMPRLSHTTCGG